MITCCLKQEHQRIQDSEKEADDFSKRGCKAQRASLSTVFVSKCHQKSRKWGSEPALPRSHDTRSSIAPFDKETLTMQASLRGSGLADELVQPKQATQDESNQPWTNNTSTLSPPTLMSYRYELAVNDRGSCCGISAVESFLDHVGCFRCKMLPQESCQRAFAQQRKIPTKEN